MIAPDQIRPGLAVVLTTPDNPRLDRRPAVVREVTEYGAVVTTGVGSGEFRAQLTELEPAPPAATERAATRATGYSGDTCSRCGSVRMRRAGVCLVCDDCGDTSGGCG